MTTLSLLVETLGFPVTSWGHRSLGSACPTKILLFPWQSFIPKCAINLHGLSARSSFDEMTTSSRHRMTGSAELPPVLTATESERSVPFPSGEKSLSMTTCAHWKDTECIDVTYPSCASPALTVTKPNSALLNDIPPSQPRHARGHVSEEVSA